MSFTFTNNNIKIRTTKSYARAIRYRSNFQIFSSLITKRFSPRHRCRRNSTRGRVAAKSQQQKTRYSSIFFIFCSSIIDSQKFQMDNDRVIDFLGRVPLLQRLPDSSVKKIAEFVQLKHYESGEYVAREGEVGDGIYFIWEGEAEVGKSVLEEEVENREDLKLKQYDYFGHGTLVSYYQADVIALTKLTCLVLPHAYKGLLQPKSIWKADENNETFALVERILQMDQIEGNIFRGDTLPNFPKEQQVYGGQFVGQALAAATKTVDSLKLVHSLHCYFQIAGNPDMPITYLVHRLGDGKSSATRRVEAIQYGNVIFTLLASFQTERKGFEHQTVTMPSVPGPETLLSLEELRERRVFDARFPRDYRNKLATRKYPHWPVDIRFCETNHKTNQTKTPPSLRFWIKVVGKLSDDMALHRSAVAYMSDFLFIPVSLNPHRMRGMKSLNLSLNHSIWFHRSFRADEWILNEIESPSASNARGFVFSRMFNRKGELIASIRQEGLIKRARTPIPVSQSKI